MSAAAEVAAEVETKALVSLKSLAETAAGTRPPPPKVNCCCLLILTNF
jgi:hypothetical protein